MNIGVNPVNDPPKFDTPTAGNGDPVTGHYTAQTDEDKPVSGKVEGRTLLVQFIRENLRLTGTHVGCDTTQCGCCTVLLDGRAIQSCATALETAEGRSVTTIEGLGTDAAPHPLQQAFIEEQAGQCGYCPSGNVSA